MKALSRKTYDVVCECDKPYTPEEQTRFRLKHLSKAVYARVSDTADIETKEINFAGQNGIDILRDVLDGWENMRDPDTDKIVEFPNNLSDAIALIPGRERTELAMTAWLKAHIGENQRKN